MHPRVRLELSSQESLGKQMVLKAIRLEQLYRGMRAKRKEERLDDLAPARLMEEEELLREENQERSCLKRNEGYTENQETLVPKRALPTLALPFNTLWELEQTSLRLGFLIYRV